MQKNKINAVIRAFEPSDLPGFAEMMNMPGVIHGTLQLPFRSLDERKKRNESFQAQVQIVADVDGVIAGHASLQLAQSPRRRHVGDVGIVVRDDYRRNGIGEALMRELLNYSDKWLGLRRIKLNVYADNDAAIALYEKLGFVREGVLRGDAFRDGEFLDAVIMARIKD